MIGITEASIGFLLLIGFLFLGLHVAVAMFLTALLGAALYLGPPLVAAFGTQLWGAMEDYVLWCGLVRRIGCIGHLRIG